MKKITRADLIGHKLDLECHKAKTTTNEYGPNDKRVYCYGLYDDHTENLCSKCSECKAYVYNSTPLRKELMSKELQALAKIKLDCDYQFENEHEKEFAIIETALKKGEKLESMYGNLEKTLVKVNNEKEKYKKALKIIKEKRMDIYWLQTSPNLSHYNLAVGTNQKLKKAEYELLKEVLK